MKAFHDAGLSVYDINAGDDAYVSGFDDFGSGLQRPKSVDAKDWNKKNSVENGGNGQLRPPQCPEVGLADGGGEN